MHYNFLSISGAVLEAVLETVCYGAEYVIPSNYEYHLLVSKLFFKPTYPEGSPKILVLDKLAVSSVG